MTSRATEIQTLIAEIDNLLINKGKRLPRVLSNQGQELRQLLEAMRNFLVREAETQHEQQPKLPPQQVGFVEQGNSQPQQNQPHKLELGNSVEASEQYSAFSALLTPLQAELQVLLQERATLVQEIRQLEQRRLHNYSLAQQVANQEKTISEFLQVLISRLTPRTGGTMATQPPFPADATNSQQSLTNLGDAELASQFLKPLDQVEQLAQLTTQLDQRLLALDGTVNVVFEGLQRNIHTYQESLSQALARMHSQGAQGEQLLVSLINNLMQKLQQQNVINDASNLSIKTETLPLNSLATATNLPVEVETPIVPDLDAVLLFLEQERQKTSDTAITASTTELRSESVVVGDEVDQLYASLFDSDNLIETTDELAVVEAIPQQPVTDVTNKLAVVEVTPQQPVKDELVVDVPILSSTPVVNQVQQPDSDVAIPDPWFDEADAGLLVSSVYAVNSTEPSDLSHTFVIEASQEATESTRTVEEPAKTDTIAVLTDLLPDVSSSETSEVSVPVNAQNVEVAQKSHESKVPISESKSKIISNFAAELSNYSQLEILDNGDLEQSLDDYIRASKNENLLSYEGNPQATTVPEISIEEEQLRQLEQDLANFDQQLSSLMQHATSTEIKAHSEKTSVQELELNSSATASLLPETEKKKEVIIEESDSLSISHSANNVKSENTVEAIWYLGIDIGTTGISAALLNRSTIEVYPIYWSPETQSAATSTRSFRLPAEVYLPTTSVIHPDLSKQAQDQLSVPSSSPDIQTHSLSSAQLKPYLQISLPYKSDGQKWEPVLQLNESSTVPLIWVVRSLSKLLLTLKSDRSSTTDGLTAAATSLDQQTFHHVINNIAGAIVTCPSNWSEQYRFNVREALLISHLVQHSQQVFFVEEAIASLLSELDGADDETVKLSSPQGVRSAKTSDYQFLGNTLAINVGATFTEMALVDLPENLEDLTHSDFMLHGFAYAGKGIEQDLICQMLFPAKWRQSRTHNSGETHSESNQWEWKPTIPGLDQMRFSSLVWADLNLPRPGEPDITDRIRLSQRLESSLVGKAILEAANVLKLILQHQDSFTLELADQRWVLQRRDLESQVFVPFVRRLNRELNRLLIAKGVPTEAISQAILTGGVASIGAVSRWLRQKLPNAKMIQDSYLDENGAPTCSRVAYGLAMLPLHPQILEVPRQQYTDYFLFTELLQLLPERTISFSEIIHLFESRGINTRSCQQRLLAFLENELPAGLIPSAIDSIRLTQSSKENPDYQAIAAAPLFEKQGNLSYRPNWAQLQCVLRYLDAIKASTGQSISEPYTVNFAIGVVN